jgi:hypothetical protein
LYSSIVHYERNSMLNGSAALLNSGQVAKIVAALI